MRRTLKSESILNNKGRLFYTLCCAKDGDSQEEIMVKLILEGWFQCSQDDWSKEMKVVEIENEKLEQLIKAGWKVVGSDSIRDKTK